jgi:hypothetical protein
MVFHSRTCQSYTAFQNVKKNKDECIQLMEHIHQVLYALVNLHTKSETPGSLPPDTLLHVGEFMEYVPSLMKLHYITNPHQDYSQDLHIYRSPAGRKQD